MRDSCRCFDVRARVVMDEPKLSGKLDFSGEIILCSDGEDYKRGYEEGHAKGLADGQKVGYENGYNEGQIDGHKSGYEAGKTEGLTEGYDNGYEKGKTDGYKDGYEEGYSKGYSQGLIDGKKEEQEKSIKITKNGTTEILPDENKVLSKVTVDVNVADSFYDALWDAYQESGTRANYAYAFYGRGWTDVSFKPKYDIRINGAANAMFSGAYITDLEKILEEQGVVLDFSQATNVASLFAYCPNITRIPVLDFSNVPRTSNSLFRDCKRLETLEINNVPEYEYHISTYNIWYQSFVNCNNLKNLKITGVISNSMDLKSSSLLTMESVNNIINTLGTYDDENSRVLTLHSTVKGNLTDTQIAAITNKNWTLA